MTEKQSWWERNIGDAQTLIWVFTIVGASFFLLYIVTDEQFVECQEDLTMTEERYSNCRDKVNELIKQPNFCAEQPQPEEDWTWEKQQQFEISCFESCCTQEMPLVCEKLCKGASCKKEQPQRECIEWDDACGWVHTQEFWLDEDKQVVKGKRMSTWELEQMMDFYDYNLKQKTVIYEIEDEISHYKLEYWECWDEPCSEVGE